MKTTTKSTCCYCGVGCGLLVDAEDGVIVGVKGDPEHPANYGRLCTKGATLNQTAISTSRLLHPTRKKRGEMEGATLTWDVALDEVADKFAEIIRAHGPDSVAFYISGQLMTEDYYVFNKLAKGLIGTNNVDTNSRLCMSSAVAGYKQTLGADAPPCSYEDFAHAKMILIAGANPALAHPIIFRYVEDAKAANPNLKIVVVDPRRSESAEIADLHLPINPGTDIALFNSMLHVMIAEELISPEYIASHTQGFAELAALVRTYTPLYASEVCGVPAGDIVKAARWFATSGAALSLYCQGLNQSAHGTHNNASLIHLHLATGQIGYPGAGPFSLTGQPNAMGGREVGGLSNLLSAHRDMANPEHRAEIARIWGIDDVPATPGKAAINLFRALKSGEVKAVWIACTNPAQSLPFQADVRAGLAAAEYVVLQEAYGNTDTVPYADMLLPASGWGEKHGTVTNSERRITHVQPVVAPPGEARHDWEIVIDFARKLGERLGNEATQRLFPYTTLESIFDEHKLTTKGRDLDISGLSYALLDEQGPQQWPYPEGATSGKARLYEDGVFPTADGRAKFVKTEHRPVSDLPNPAYPISLLSGRMRDHWHGMSRTGTVPRLYNLEDEPVLSMHPCDMRHRGLLSGMLAKVSNDRGAFIVRVEEVQGLKKGRAWMPMHWGSQFMNSAGVNTVACDATDPFSSQPELKHTAVQIESAALAYPITVIRHCETQQEALALQSFLRDKLSDFPYANVSLYGRRCPLVIFRAAMASPAAEDQLAEIDTWFGLASHDTLGVMSLTDAKRSIFKKAIMRDGRLYGVRLAGESQAQHWLKKAMAEDELGENLLRFVLAPTAKAPAAVAPRNIVCKCADVSDVQINDALAAGASFSSLQETLKCGTFCGSCVPEIKKMVAAHASLGQATA